MNKKINIKSFILGVCVALTLTSIISVSAQNIDVIMNGIKIYWDGVEKTLTDANGNKVEPMIYQGTTYVPLRAMSNLMGKEVDWNQSEMAVYVGTKPTMRTIPLADMEENINNRTHSYISKYSFNLKNKVVSCNSGAICIGSFGKNGNGWLGGEDITYVLDGKFSRFTGKMVLPYEEVGSKGEQSVSFYSVENDGTENEIKSYKLKRTEDPIDVDVNLKGVTNLKIKATYSSDYNGYTVIYDAYFLGE